MSAHLSYPGTRPSPLESLNTAPSDAGAPPSSFLAGDEMKVAVRMVTPLRREFGRTLDVSLFLHNPVYAQQMIDLAKSSRDMRLRGYAAFLDSGKSRGTPAQAARAVLSSAQVLAEVKRRTARHVLALLGPTADALCLKIEAAATMDEFVAQARRAHGVVRDFRGAERTDDFGDLVASLIG